MSRCSILAVVLLMLLAGCTHNRPFRAIVGPACKMQLYGECSKSIQHEIIGKGANAFITYVEFDEQGEMHERESAKLALAKLAKRAEERQSLMLLFAHGWKHNASADDGNVQDFQKQLLAVAESINSTSAMPVNVEGVYIGWRGLSVKAAGIKEATFWARKRAAGRIGIDGVAEVVAELGVVRTRKPADGGRHTLVLTGHSFGGALLYSATAHLLLRELVQLQACMSNGVESAVRSVDVASLTGEQNASSLLDPRIQSETLAACQRIVPTVGDLVVLVNPAIEQARFTSIEKRASELHFGPGQKPVFAVFMSREDGATRTWFPLGRRLSTMFNLYKNPSQRSRDVQALGHIKSHWTHDLDFPTTSPPITESPYARFYETLSGPTLKWDQYVCGKIDTWQAGNGTLKRISGTHSPYSPYMIVSVDGDGISSHSDIWSPNFTDFVQRFIASGVLRPDVDCSHVPDQ